MVNKSHIYRNKFVPTRLIEFVGQDKGDWKFRYLDEEFKEIFFAISRQEVGKYWERVKNNENKN